MGALTDEWFRKPYAELVAEAIRVDAIVGPASHVQNWRPDTCRCKLQMVFEGVKIRTLDSKGKIGATFVRNEAIEEHEGEVIVRCPFHQLASPSDHFQAVIQENRLKNHFHGAIQDAFPGVKEFHYKWSFDGDRNLVVDLSGLPEADKQKIRNLAADPKRGNKIRTNG